jgi:hypothetical protein
MQLLYLLFTQTFFWDIVVGFLLILNMLHATHVCICFVFNSIKMDKIEFILELYKKTMNVFIRAILKIFSVGEKWNFTLPSAVAS